MYCSVLYLQYNNESHYYSMYCIHYTPAYIIRLKVAPEVYKVYRFHCIYELIRMQKNNNKEMMN